MVKGLAASAVGVMQPEAAAAAREGEVIGTLHVVCVNLVPYPPPSSSQVSSLAGVWRKEILPLLLG